MKGKKSQKDADGNILPEYQKYILSNLVRECTDFKEEKSSMEKLMEKLSDLAANKALLLTTPKCYCELAAEGLDLGWGLAKRKYRNITLAEKKRKENFDNGVKSCIKFVQKHHMQKFAARCR